MNGKRVRVGSMAVLFSMVALCAAIFSVLAALTAASDLKNAERYGEYVEKAYALESEGERWLARADAYLADRGSMPENTRAENGMLSAELSADGAVLEIELDVSEPEKGFSVERWRYTVLWEPEEEWTLWEQGG